MSTHHYSSNSHHFPIQESKFELQSLIKNDFKSYFVLTDTNSMEYVWVYSKCLMFLRRMLALGTIFEKRFKFKDKFWLFTASSAMISIAKITKINAE